MKEMKKMKGEKDKFDVLLTGVGGEGVLTSAVLVAKAANIEGYEVRGTMLHGLAQRGGSIPTHVRLGNVHSPWIMEGNADLIITFEPIEALRACYYASKDTTILVDNYKIKPVYSHIFNEQYPGLDEIGKELKRFCKRHFFVDASIITRKELGHVIYGNTMLLGVAVGNGLLPLSKNSMIKALKATVPRGLNENLKAFHMGLDIDLSL